MSEEERLEEHVRSPLDPRGYSNDLITQFTNEEKGYGYESKFMSADDARIDNNTMFLLVSDASKPEGYVLPKACSALSPLLTSLLGEDNTERQSIIPAMYVERKVLYLLALYLHNLGTTPEKKPSALQKPYPGKQFHMAHLTPFEYAYANFYFPPPDSKWTPDTVDTDLTNFIGVLNAANFLQITPLLELVACALAFHLKGRTPNQIKQLMSRQRLPVTQALDDLTQ